MQPWVSKGRTIRKLVGGGGGAKYKKNIHARQLTR